MNSNYEAEAQELIPIIEQSLRERSLSTPLEYVLTTSSANNTWLFAVLANDKKAAQNIGKLEAYTSPNTLHQISTYLGGKHVAVSNSSGLRLGILLSPKPELPAMLTFPGANPDKIILGRSLTEEISLPWARFGHWAIGGMTDFGKSNLIALIALQAIHTNAQIAVMDIQGRTLPHLKYSPRKLFYASDEESCMEGIDSLWGEYQKRQKAFEKLEPGFFASNLLAYNKHTGQNLPLIIAFVEEFVELRQGISDESIRRLESLSRLSRKYGIHLVLAGQDWSKEETGAIKAQCHVKISVKMADHYQSRMLLGFAGAEKLTHPGRALSNKFGATPFQTYYVDEEEVGRFLLAGSEQTFVEQMSISSTGSKVDHEFQTPPRTSSEPEETRPIFLSEPPTEPPVEPLAELSEGQLLSPPAHLTLEERIMIMLKWGVSYNAISLAFKDELKMSRTKQLEYFNHLKSIINS